MAALVIEQVSNKLRETNCPELACVSSVSNILMAICEHYAESDKVRDRF